MRPIFNSLTSKQRHAVADAQLDTHQAGVAARLTKNGRIPFSIFSIYSCLPSHLVAQAASRSVLTFDAVSAPRCDELALTSCDFKAIRKKVANPAVGSLTREHLAEIHVAFHRPEVNAIVGYFAADGVFQPVRGADGYRRKLTAKDEIRAFLSERFKAMPDLYWAVDAVWFSGDRATSE